MTAPNEVIVVDDDPALRAMLLDYLTMQGFSVRTAENGTALDNSLRTRGADLIVLDVNMPGEDGLSIARRLRGKGCKSGIIVLTANDDGGSRIRGLAEGADDYVAKPFEPRELLARMRSVLRRVAHDRATLPTAEPARIKFGALALDLGARRLMDGQGNAIELTAKEFALLSVFAKHPRMVLSRDRLAELADGAPTGADDRSIDIRITRLRKKIEPDPAAPRLIKTVRGEGYVFEPE